MATNESAADDPHFEFLAWRITLPFARAELDSSIEAQGVFVHEYIHYLQALAGTLGRIQLLDLVRLAAFAALHLTRKPGTPLTEQIDVDKVLSAASPSAFENSRPKDQYRYLVGELRFLLTHEPQPKVDLEPGATVALHRTVGIHSVDGFQHVVAEYKGRSVAVPLTHRVFFENMARQVQRRFQYFQSKGELPDPNDRSGQSQLAYTCVHDALKRFIPAGEDHGAWTIWICCLAIRCRHPDSVFAHVMKRLSHERPQSLRALEELLNADPFFADEFNRPPLQPALEKLVHELGTVMRMTENYELRELTEFIVNISNDIRDDRCGFENPLPDLNQVRRWLRRYGCPPVECTDGPLTVVFGVPTTAPFHKYLAHLKRLLS